jgi:hypothetical protein
MEYALFRKIAFYAACIALATAVSPAIGEEIPEEILKKAQEHLAFLMDRISEEPDYVRILGVDNTQEISSIHLGQPYRYYRITHAELPEFLEATSLNDLPGHIGYMFPVIIGDASHGCIIVNNELMVGYQSETFVNTYIHASRATYPADEGNIFAYLNVNGFHHFILLSRNGELFITAGMERSAKLLSLTKINEWSYQLIPLKRAVPRLKKYVQERIESDQRAEERLKHRRIIEEE